MSLIKTQSLKGSAIAAALLVANNITPADAHSWVEQVRRIAPNGTFVGEPGYARGMIARDDPNFTDSALQYLLPPNGRAEGPVILDSDNIAKNGIDSYTEQFPRLSAAPGELIALRYQENGHVSLPENTKNKPLNRGTVYVYGTAKASDDDKILDILHEWTTDGNGGDKRGKLIATRNYDDGQCHEANGGEISSLRAQKFPKQDDALQGPKLWCQVDVRIPEDIAAGSVYTMYWVWDWPTLKPELVETSKDGKFPTQGDGVEKPEVYTSAIDIDIVAADDATNQNFAKPGKSAASDFDAEQDVGNMAIKDQLENMFLVDPSESDTDPVNGGDESSSIEPSVGTESAVPGATNAPEAEASSVTGVPESAQATVTVTVTEPTTLLTVVTKFIDGTASAPTSTPSDAGEDSGSGFILPPKPKARPRGLGIL
ncbi:hypothetical protein VUR80DRAFT_632 [Thermomyces stellatus]